MGRRKKGVKRRRRSRSSGQQLSRVQRFTTEQLARAIICHLQLCGPMNLAELAHSLSASRADTDAVLSVLLTTPLVKKVRRVKKVPPPVEGASAAAETLEVASTADDGAAATNAEAAPAAAPAPTAASAAAAAAPAAPVAAAPTTAVAAAPTAAAAPAAAPAAPALAPAELPPTTAALVPAAEPAVVTSSDEPVERPTEVVFMYRSGDVLSEAVHLADLTRQIASEQRLVESCVDRMAQIKVELRKPAHERSNPLALLRQLVIADPSLQSDPLYSTMWRRLRLNKDMDAEGPHAEDALRSIRQLDADVTMAVAAAARGKG